MSDKDEVQGFISVIFLVIGGALGIYLFNLKIDNCYVETHNIQQCYEQYSYINRELIND